MVETWKNNTPEPSLAAFALHFMGLIVSDWKRFELLQVTDVVGQVSDLLKHQNCDNSSVKLAYVRMLSGLLKHDSGCKWIVQTGTEQLLSSVVTIILHFYVLTCMHATMWIIY
jgi:hypothetical protein